jgi:hypothetical protein
MSKIDGEALYRAINKWEETAPAELLLDMKAYKDYFLNEWGIKIGSITVDHTVVNEKKYMLFLLRWS